MIAARGRRRRTARSCSARRSRPASPPIATTSASRRAGRRRSSSSSRPGCTACGSAGRARRSPTDAPADDQRPYNTLVLAAPDGTQHRYRKIHPFTYGGETKHFRAGDQFVTVDIEGLRVTLVRLLRPALRRRVLAARQRHRRVPRAGQLARGAAAAVDGAAAGAGDREPGVRRRAATASATATGSPYSGDTRIIDPLGEVLASAAHTESILLADISAERVADVRDRFRFLQDRR